MKVLLFAVLLLSGMEMQAQDVYQGKYYSCGKKENWYQSLLIHYGKDGNILFYMECGKGAPSYNSGAIYGRLTVDGKTGHMLYTPGDTSECYLEFVKEKKDIMVKTLKGDCPFGHGVSADGVYKMTRISNPASFTDRHGKPIYFDKTPPEEYFR